MQNNETGDRKASEQTQTAPYFKQVIDGQEFTVLIHFSESTSETATDKMKRILAREARNGAFKP